MKKLICILLGLVSAIFIICAAVIITLNCRLLYEADIYNYNLVENTGMDKDEILANYQAMIDYNNLGGPDVLEFPTLTMSESGRKHFEEVRDIFFAIEYMAIFCGAVTVFALVYTFRKKLYAYRLWTAVFTLALPAAVGLMAAVSWDSFFVFFHKLMFDNDYWIFDSASDPVITILPDGYFLHCVIMIVLIAFAAAAGFILWYIHGKRSLKKHA